MQDSQINPINDFLDEAEAIMSQYPPADIKVKSRFVDGLYIRTMSAPAGTIMTSKIHNTQHGFHVVAGKILVYDGLHEPVILQAPYSGITLPGTRRIGQVIEDVIWVNVHITDIRPENDSEEALEKAVNLLQAQIIEPYKNLKLEQ